VHLGSPTPFSVYLRRQERAAAQIGIQFRSVALPAGADAGTLRSTLQTLNGDPSVNGVLVEHPLPAGLDFPGACAMLAPTKDVDGIGPVNLGRLVAHRPGPVPAVARAAIEIARFYRLPLAGRKVAVIGRSESVGLPLALMLLGRGPGGDATVTVAHSRTADLGAALAGAEVVFSCAGHPGLLDRGNVPRGASVIDIGLSMVPDPGRQGGLRGAGDADADSLDGWAAALTPVPGGVGPVSVACLMLAVAEARARQLAPEGPT
jgi:methylenetetrahydrofolate dehydrogenase (NADP+) / methenyltetrahydrofolate cyclohydrolase